ncbi:MAG: hypothetical protein AB1522_14300 [Chloroflexota bacterium]
MDINSLPQKKTREPSFSIHIITNTIKKVNGGKMKPTVFWQMNKRFCNQKKTKENTAAPARKAGAVENLPGQGVKISGWRFAVR